MKIAISSNGETLENSLDLRFGRARGFLIYDLDTDSYKYMDNEQNLNAAKGAGIQSAQNVIDEGVSAVITGYCGPKAFNVLNMAEIKIYTSEQLKIKDIIEKFKNNELKEQEKDS